VHIRKLLAPIVRQKFLVFHKKWSNKGKRYSMEKKSNLSSTISIIAVVISALALYLAFTVHKESRAIVFIWEVSPRNDIPVKLKQERLITEEGKPTLRFYLPICLEYKVTNTGLRTFSVDSIMVYINYIQKEPEMYKSCIINLGFSLINPPNFSHGITREEKIKLPIVVKSGYSKVMFSKFNLPIPKKLYNAYKNKFKGQDFTLAEIYELYSNDLRISNNFDYPAKSRSRSKAIT
jgi:hypothetical protein